MRHVLVPLHIVHTAVWFNAYQAGVAIVSHVNSVVSLDKMMRAEENLAFYTVTRHTWQMRRRWRQTRRRWRQIRRIWTDLDAFLRRNGTLMHIQRDLWPHTTDPTWTSDVMYITPTHYIFMIMQIRPHPSLLFITLFAAWHHIPQGMWRQRSRCRHEYSWGWWGVWPNLHNHEYVMSNWGSLPLGDETVTSE